MIEVAAPSLKRLLSDWESWRRGRESPSRADFTPFDLKYIMGNLALLDVLYDPLRFRYRLYGCNLRVRLGKEMTNKSIDDIPTPIHRRLAKEHYTDAIYCRVPTVRLREHDLITKDAPHDCEVLVLPLSSNGKTIDILMNALVWDTE
jgi:hypothetical protein